MAAATVALSGSGSVSALDPREYLWNPYEVLEIEPLGYGYTCIGKEVTKGGSKCISPLEKEACDLAKDLLDDIRKRDMVEQRHMTQTLQALARLLLCHSHHQYQAAEKTREWALKVREHSQGLKGGSTGISSSDILAMNIELGQIKSQLASIALKYSNLREKHVAVLYENETLRQRQIKLQSEHDSTIILLSKEMMQRETRLSQELFKSEQLRERAVFNLRDRLIIQNTMWFTEGLSSHRDSDPIKPDLSVEQKKQLALSIAWAAFSEEPNHSPKSQHSLEGLSALMDQILSIFFNDHTLEPLLVSALRNNSHGVIPFDSNILQFLLREFGTELHDEAQGVDQKNITRIIRICANDLAVAIISHLSYEDIMRSKLVQEGKLYPADSAQLLSLFLFFRSNGARIPIGSRDNPDLGHFPVDTASATKIYENQNSGVLDSADEFANVSFSLPDLKQLIVESEAFNTLRQKLEQFVQQEHSVSVSSFTSTVSFAKDNDRIVKFTPWTTTIRPGFIDRSKRIIEKWVRSPIIWWPLQPPRLSCPDGYMRISWACVSSFSELLKNV